jgi:plasmid stabilization system protein ParE
VKLTWVMAPITEHDLAAAAVEAYKVAQDVRKHLDDEDEQAIRAFELYGLTRRQLLQRLTKLAAEMDRLANDDDPTAGTLAEWAPATRAMFGKLTKPDLIRAVLEDEELVEPAAAYRRRLLAELALRLAMNPRGGPVFQDRADLEQLSPTERDLLMTGAAQALERWWKTPAGEAERCRQMERRSDPPWF